MPSACLSTISSAAMIPAPSPGLVTIGAHNIAFIHFNLQSIPTGTGACGPGIDAKELTTSTMVEF